MKELRCEVASRAGIVRMRENLIKYFNSWYESIVEDMLMEPEPSEVQLHLSVCDVCLSVRAGGHGKPFDPS